MWRCGSTTSSRLARRVHQHRGDGRWRRRVRSVRPRRVARRRHEALRDRRYDERPRRGVPTADFTNALPVGGGAPAGTTRSDSLAAVTYDPTADVLYVFSRNCYTATGLDPSVFRLTRDGNGAFQVESYQPLPAGTIPVARASSGLRAVLRQGPDDPSLRLRGERHRHRDRDPWCGHRAERHAVHARRNDPLVTSHLNVLYRVSTATWTAVPGGPSTSPRTASSTRAASRSSATSSS